MPAVSSREIRLAARPKGFPTPECFELARTEVPPPADGQVLVRNLFMSVDPYMRGRMNDAKSYVPPFALGKVLDGGAVGEVVESRAPGFAPGDAVLSGRGWREAFVAPPKELTRVDRGVGSLSHYLGALGMPGFTAWLGLDLVGTKAGDVVFVSGAAGAVGSVVGQLAKHRGCRVVGSAGSEEKVRVLTQEIGFDAAFSYKDGDLPKKLEAAAPGGIDVYFDNVGGEQLEAAIGALRQNGRIAACGAISRYNDEKAAPGPRNMFLFVTKRLTMRGFIVMDHMARQPEFFAAVAPLVASGKLVLKETVVEGIERAPQAFLDMLHGGNTGKMLVRI